MKENDKFINLERLLNKLKEDDQWGTYFMGKYYFSIFTGRTKMEFGIEQEPKTISQEIQLRLQKENYAALFHEYVHYLHELSTIIGSFGLSLDLSLKSLFSLSLDPDLYSSKSLGIISQPKLLDKFVKIFTTQSVVMGGLIDEIPGKILQIKGVSNEKQTIYVPHENGTIESEIEVPIITFTYEDNRGKIFTEKLHLGKFFLYEGIAYELDRIVDKNVKQLYSINDDLEGTEYTVLRMVSKYIFPQIETVTYLALATLSLQYVDCGKSLVNMLLTVKESCSKGSTQEEIVNHLKNETSNLLKKGRPTFIAVLEEFRNIFLKRQRLIKAFSYLIDKMLNLYDIRIIQPAIEVDYVFSGKFRNLLDDTIQICDYMYVFKGDDEYMRDFLGTSIDLDTSDALKILLSFDDFYKSHKVYNTEKAELSPHECPFYTCCNLQLRKTYSETCRTKPWRIFEISSNIDRKYCWYGQGVLEFKGVNEK